MSLQNDLRAGRLTTEVIICTYNGEKFVIEQLKSILGQTKSADKISIYDDGSSDGTVILLGEFIDSLPLELSGKIWVTRNEKNLGYAENFAGAIAKSTQDILFLCDQDDVWETEKIACLSAILEDSTADLVFSDGSLIRHDGEPMEAASVLEIYGLTHDNIDSFREHAHENLVKRNYINGAALAVRRNAAQLAMPLPCAMPHDYWLAIWCACHGGVSADRTSLYRYRQHASNVIGISSGKLLYEWIGVWRQPRKPRTRELTIFQAITTRLSVVEKKSCILPYEAKLAWLSAVANYELPAIKRFYLILSSIISGKYERFGSWNACFRDIVALIKK